MHTMSMFASYQNHVVHTSLYVAIIGCCIQKLQSSLDHHEESSFSDLCSWWFYGTTGVVALWFIKGEIQYIRQRTRLPPGDSGYPIVGHFVPLIKDPALLMATQSDKYGSIFTMNLLGRPIISITDDDDASWFISQERQGHLVTRTMPHIKELIGPASIMFAGGKHLRRLRKIFEPAYSPNTLKNYIDLIDRIAQETLQEWAFATSGDNFQSGHDAFAKLTMKVFCSCTFGEEFATDDVKLQQITYLFKMYTAGARFPFNFRGSPLNKAHQFKNQLDHVIQQIIEEFQQQSSSSSSDSDDTAKTSTTTTTVMGRLCYGQDEDGNRLSKSQLIENIRFLLFAGFDSMKGSFCAFLKYLVENPKVLQALREEQQQQVQVLQAGGGEEPSLDISNMLTKEKAPVLNAFLLEAWRLAAPVHVHATQATVDLQYKGYYIPKGTGVSLDIHHYNFRNEIRFPFPGNFEIGRFLPEGHKLHNSKLYKAANGSGGSDGSGDSDGGGSGTSGGSVKYRTFNIGPHTCLGKHFAKIEGSIVVTRLIQNYDIEIQNEGIKKFPMRQVTLDFRLSPREGKTQQQ